MYVMRRGQVKVEVLMRELVLGIDGTTQDAQGRCWTGSCWRIEMMGDWKLQVEWRCSIK